MRALRMKIDSDDLRTSIALRDRHRLASWSRAAIQYPRPFADKHCDQLRAFVLNGDLTVSKRLAPGDIAGANTSCRGKQRARVDDNAFLRKCALGGVMVKPNRRHRDGLVVLADALRGGEPILFGPTFDQPKRMREGQREIFTARVFPRRLLGELRQLAQKRIHERSRRPFAGTFHQFHTLVDGGARWYAIEPAQLIEPQSQRNENLKIKFSHRLRGRSSDVSVETRAPAQNSHDKFGG